jgi:hypothetical protein
MLDLDSDADAPYVRILVSNVTNPIAAYTSASFSWYVETVRFQTGNVIEKSTYSSGPTVTTGDIVTTSLTPTWGTDVAAIVRGMELLTDLSVTLTNPTPVPATSLMAIGAKVFATIDGVSSATGIQATANGYVYVYFDLTSTCALATNVITWSIRSQLAQSATVTCRAKLTFSTTIGTSFGLSNVYSENLVGDDIDKRSALLSAGIILDNSGDGSDLLTSLSFFMHTTAAGTTNSLEAGANNAATNHFKWEF